MVVTTSARPVDRLLAGYNLLLAAIWLVLAEPAWRAAPIPAAHAAAATLPWLLARAGDRLSRGGRLLREVYPLLWLGGFWSELGLLNTAANDAAVQALEFAVFGEHASQTWIRALPALWVSEAMHAVYFAYYLAIYLPPIAALVSGRKDALRDMTFRLAVTYTACYLVYIAFPVDGPQHTLGRAAGAHTEGFFYALVHWAQGIGEQPGAALPSSHVAGAVTMAFVSWRWFDRGVAALLTVEAVGVCLSSVYTQHHYAVDAVAGVVWALGLQLAVVPWLNGVLRRRHQ